MKINISMHRLFLCFTALVFLALSGFFTIAKAKELQVITSIKPIHSLVSRVMGDKGKAILLLKKHSNPHLFRMRPSHMRAVVNADALFFISTDFEQFLAPMVKRSNPKLTKVAFVKDSHIRLIPYRKNKIWGNKHVSQNSQDQDTRGTLKNDLHIWLDPDNARRMAVIIEETLSRLDPSNAITYFKNSKALISDLYKLEEKIRIQLRPFKEKKIIVYHDSFQYFENSFFLTSLGAIQLTADKTPSIKHLSILRKIAAQSNVSCVIGMPGVHPQIATVVHSHTKAGYATVDPLGLTYKAGPELYFKMMSDIAASLIDCEGLEAFDDFQFIISKE